MRYFYRTTGEVTADDEKEARDKILAGVELENVEIEDGPDELEKVEDEEDEEK